MTPIKSKKRRRLGTHDTFAALVPNLFVVTNSGYKDELKRSQLISRPTYSTECWSYSKLCTIAPKVAFRHYATLLLSSDQMRTNEKHSLITGMCS